MKQIKFVYDNEVPIRADRLISERIENLSRSAVSKLIIENKVLVNNNPLAKSYKITKGDIVSINIPDPVDDVALPENIPLDIVYEDEDLLVVNKAKGMVVHPAPGHYSGTLVNALLYHCKNSLSGINGVLRPGIVHRIDKDTSGLLIVAKNDNAHLFLAEQIKVHSFKREYEAITDGVIKDDCGTISAPIGRHPIKRKQMAVTNKCSKDAITHYKVLKRYEKNTYVKLKLETGRTHQIRVHLSYIGKPVLNDPIYNTKHIKDFEGQCLHAKLIGFIHPNGNYLEFESELPDYFKNYLSKLDRSEL